MPFTGGKSFPAILSVSLMLTLPFFFLGTGSTKVTQEPQLVASLEPGLATPPQPARVAALRKKIVSSPAPHPVTEKPQASIAKVPLVLKEEIKPKKTSYSQDMLKPLEEWETKWERIEDRKTFMNRRARYTVLVDKANLKLYVAQRQSDHYQVIRELSVSIGLIQGNKVKRGDFRTPEGIYKVIGIKFDEELAPKYGPMAFVLSYPNGRDKLLGKTGSGIWLHGTGQKILTPDTKGCVELTDEGILDLSAFVAYKTPIFIFPERRPLTKIGNRIPISVVNGLEMEYVQELPLLKARLAAKKRR